MADAPKAALHEQASALYLSGNYAGALTVWNQILQIDPSDEQAAEGARLCAHLVSADPSASPGQDPEDDPVADEAFFGEILDDVDDAASAEPLGSPLEDLGGNLLEQAFDAEIARSNAAPAGCAASLRDSLDEFDLNDLGSEGVATGGVGEGGSGSGMDLSDLDSAMFDDEIVEVSSDLEDAAPASAPRTAAAATPTPVEAEAAAMELRRRVNELLASALAAMEGGDRDESLGILGRVLILDEHNEAATSLRDKILHEIEVEGRPLPTAGAAASNVEDMWDDELVDLPPPLPAAVAAPEPPPSRPSAAPPRTTAAARVAVSSSRLEEFQDDDDAEVLETDAEVSRSTEPKTPPRAGSRLPSLAWLPRVDLGNRAKLLSAGALVVVLGGAYLGWRALSATPAEAIEGEASVNLQADAAPASATPAGISVTGAGATSTGPSPASAAAGQAATGSAGSTKDVDALLRRAEAAFGKGDYPAAILAYNEALTVRPEDAGIQERLLVAGNRYREERERSEQWDQAIKAFENSDFRTALRLFYRMPTTEDQAKLQRYIANGWYNLGVQSLKSRTCQEAVDHLREAESAKPTDNGIRSALRLAQSCPRERNTTSFVVAIESLGYRSVDD
jgi:tetratricopeptide (TPR) repeat protein